MTSASPDFNCFTTSSCSLTAVESVPLANCPSDYVWSRFPSRTLGYFCSSHPPPPRSRPCAVSQSERLQARLILSPSPCASPPKHVWIDLNGVIVTALPLSSVFGKSDANGGRERREKAE